MSEEHSMRRDADLEKRAVMALERMATAWQSIATVFESYVAGVMALDDSGGTIPPPEPPPPGPPGP